MDITTTTTTLKPKKIFKRKPTGRPIGTTKESWSRKDRLFWLKKIAKDVTSKPAEKIQAIKLYTIIAGDSKLPITDEKGNILSYEFIRKDPDTPQIAQETIETPKIEATTTTSTTTAINPNMFVVENKESTDVKPEDLSDFLKTDEN